MSKRKRQRRNRTGRRNRGQQISGLAAIGNKVRSSFKGLRGARRWQLFAAVAGGLLLLAGIWTQKMYFTERALLHRLPDLDLSGVETQVVLKIRGLRKEVERNPGSAAAWGKLAMNLDVHDLKREAASCYQQAAELDPTDFRWPYYCATMLAATGSPEALQWFKRSQVLKPDYTPVHVLYGQTLFNHGHLKEALEQFEWALRTDAKSTHAYLGLAQVALSQGDLQASRRYLLKAAEIDPKHGEVHGLLAEVYRRLNEPEKADREMRLAQQLPKVTSVPNPVYAELAAEGVSAFWYEKYGLTYLEKRLYAEAAREFTMALKAKPSAEAHYNLGFALQYLGKYEEAAQHYRAALALRPTYRDALNHLAMVLFEMGRVEESIAYLEQAKRLYPAFAAVYLNLGTFYWRSGRRSEAIETFRQGLANAPYDPRTAMQLAWLLATAPQLSLRNGEKAVHLAERVCEKTGYRVPETLDVLAAAYAETGQFNRAIKTARQALQLTKTANRSDLANQIQSRLQIYESKQPYRENKFNPK